MLTVEEFEEKLFDCVQKHFSDREGITIVQTQVSKNNGVQKGFSVKNEEIPALSPTFYYKDGYERYKEGTPFTLIASSLCDAVEDAFENIPESVINVEEDIKSYDSIKGRLFVKVVGKNGNEDYAEQCCSREFLDMYLIPYISLGNIDRFTSLTTVVRKEFADNWGIAEDEIIKTAINNTKSGFQCQNVTKTMEKMGYGEEELRERGIEISDFKAPMYVIGSGICERYGASAILDQEFLDKCMKKEKYDRMVIIPSSVHELIGLMFNKDEEAPDLGWISAMISEVNDSCLRKEDILTYTPYYKELGKDVDFYKTHA